MKLLQTFFRTSLVLSVVLAAALVVAAPPAGLWKGAIELPGSQLAIEVSLVRSGEGVWSGTIDIPAQGLRGFALADVGVGELAIGFAMHGIPGVPTFKGRYEASNQRISGDFAQGGHTFTFELEFSEPGAEDEGSLDVFEKGIPGEGVEGEWFGELDVGSMVLRLALHVQSDPEQGLSGSMDSLDQSAEGIGINFATFEEGTFAYRVSRVGGAYVGTLNGDGSELNGVWSQGGQETPLTFRRLAEAMVLKRPQDPVGPFPYEEREVTFRNEVDGISLAGTFVVPEGEELFPTVVFFSGSGPQDRDEALMGHRPFAVIADSLARRGIASLRFDDRGVGGSEGNLMNSETLSFANDAIAAIRFLEKQKEVNLDALGLIGHSEGGLVGPIVAVQDDQLDYLVLLAPPGESLDKLLLRQSADALRLRGVDEQLVMRIKRDSKQDMVYIKDRSLSREELIEKLRERAEVVKASYDEGVLEGLGLTDAVFEQSLKAVSTKWFRSLMNIDPAVYMEQLTIPTLALFAEKDFQVAAKVNAEVLEASFKRAGNEEALVRILPNLNHLFQNCETGSMSEYGKIEETFDPDTLELIGDWILQRDR